MGGPAGESTEKERSVSKRREPQSGVRPHRTGGPGTRPSPDGEPDLLDHVRELLRAGNQVGVVMLASTIVSALEQGPSLPFQHSRGSEGPSLADLVESFMDVHGHETTAVLVALAALVNEDVLRQHIRRELDRRGGPIRAGLDPLEPLSVDRTVVTTHVLGHVDMLVVGVRTAGG